MQKGLLVTIQLLKRKATFVAPAKESAISLVRCCHLLVSSVSANYAVLL